MRELLENKVPISQLCEQYEVRANSKGFLTGGGQVWLYAGSSSNENNISLFCSSAYQSEWLKRFQRKWANKYKCINPNGTYTFPPGLDWQYLGDVSTDVVEER